MQGVYYIHLRPARFPRDGGVHHLSPHWGKDLPSVLRGVLNSALLRLYPPAPLDRHRLNADSAPRVPSRLPQDVAQGQGQVGPRLRQRRVSETHGSLNEAMGAGEENHTQLKPGPAGTIIAHEYHIHQR